MRNRNPIDGLPGYMYLRKPLFYWLRYVQADPFRLALGGRYYGQDFWYLLSLGWHEMQQTES
jgi:hypothetical protein